jgi:hypothetical protein
MRRKVTQLRNAVVASRLGDPVTFYQRKFKGRWWTSTIQSYAQLRVALKGEGLHQHHLIPKSLFLRGPKRTRGLIDYIPSIPFTEAEHLRTLHPALNEYLRNNGLWQKHLSRRQLERALRLVADFYSRHGLRHPGAAIHGFRKEAYDRVVATPVVNLQALFGLRLPHK